MGTLWFHNEILFRNVIINYPDNRILLFPQTIYYEDSEWGKKNPKNPKKYMGCIMICISVRGKRFPTM